MLPIGISEVLKLHVLASCHRRHTPTGHDAGVGPHDVELAELIDGRLDAAIHRGLVAHIGGNGDRSSTLLLNQFRRLLGSIAVDVDYRNLRTFRREQLRALAPEPGSAAGDDGNFVLKLHCTLLCDGSSDAEDFAERDSIHIVGLHDFPIPDGALSPVETIECGSQFRYK